MGDIIFALVDSSCFNVGDCKYDCVWPDNRVIDMDIEAVHISLNCLNSMSIRCIFQESIESDGYSIQP